MPIDCRALQSDETWLRITARDDGGRMSQRTHSSTASGGIAIERRYVSSEGHVEQSSYLIIGGEEGIAGVTDPILSEPIDFEAELNERAATHEPLEPVDTDLTNRAFGI